jgi:outer membrane protein assembly complex protein YaeT
MGQTLLMPKSLLAALLLVALTAAASVPARAQQTAEEPLPTETVEAPVEAPLLPEEGEAAPPALDGAVAGDGPWIARIEIRSDAPIDQERELRDLVTFRPGDRLTEQAVRRTLRNLQATGTAYEVELHTRPIAPDALEGEGGEAVEVVLVMWAAEQIRSVGVEGELGRLSERELEREIPLTAGQPLIESRLLRGVYRLQELYEAQGYFDADVVLSVDVDEEKKRVDVVYRVDAGERARVSDIRFEGDRGPFSAAQLIERLRVEPGEPYRQSAVREDAERLREWLIEQEYRTAIVDPPREEVLPEGGEVSLTYPIEVGPRVEVEIVGVGLRELRRNDLLPFLGDQGYDEALVLQAADRTRRYFQEKGHWQVEVSYQEERREEGRVLHLRFEVVPGPEYTLQEVDFEGNEEVSDGQLSDLMETTPRRLLTLGSGRLVDPVLDDDLDNIRSYYALQGFQGYDVGPADIDRRELDLYLTVPIEEGTRRRVVELGFAGLEALDEERLRAELPLRSGGPFHPLLLEDTLRITRAYYEAEGYLSPQISAEASWNADGTLVDLTVRVIEGPQTVLDRLIIRGNVRTHQDVIEDAIELEPGEPVSRIRLLEAERNLYELGIFRRVDLDLGPADLTEPTRDVIVRVQEGRTRRVSYGLGYDSDNGPAGLLGYSQRNLFGRAFTFQSDLRFGEKERLARAILDQPTFTKYDIPMLYTVAYQEEELRSYDVARFVSQVEAVYQEDEWRYGLAFDYRIVESTLTVDPETLEPDGSPVIERRDQDVKISSLIPNLFVDRRNDPIAPTRGWSGAARFQWAFPIRGFTETDFVKTFVQLTGYQPVGFGHFAASLRGGAIEPLIDSTEDLPGVIQDEPPNLKIPIDERFFAGGDFSHRAYDKDELGIPGSTLFADGSGRGGNGLFILNLDYRFPAWGPVGGALFVDGGNVWPDWRDLDLSEIRWGAGVEARYISPIGPVRAGVGYQLNPDTVPGLDEDRVHFFLAVGNPF